MPAGRSKTGNKRDQDRFITLREKFLTKIENFNKKIKKEYVENVEEAFKAAKKYSLSRFYNEFTPKYYTRTEDLYNAMKLTIDKEEGSYEVTVNPFNLEFHDDKSKKYIYQLSFVDGFHGGSRRGKPDFLGNPFPGSYNEPYYRFPPEDMDGIPAYSLWGRPAVKTGGKTPYKRFTETFNDSMERIDARYRRLIKKVYSEELDKYIAGYRRYNIPIEDYILDLREVIKEV